MEEDFTDWRRKIPSLNARPTQPPLDRNQQQSAFERLKQQYNTEAPPPQAFPMEARKDVALSERQTLDAIKSQLQERGMTEFVPKVEEKLQENQTHTTVSQFYCRHTFQQVKANFGIIPVKYKICSKCGIVK
jgi:hypothetical protein